MSLGGELEQRIPPHNLQAEASLLGAMLLSKDAIAQADAMLMASDFYAPSHGVIFTAILRLWRDGSACDPVTVADLLARDRVLDLVGGSQELVKLQASTPATTSAPRYAKIISDNAISRRVMSLCDEILDIGYTGKCDGGELLELLSHSAANIEVPMDVLPDGFYSIEEWMSRPEGVEDKWVIPGITPELSRAVMVATEGFGKSMMLQQIALCLSQGIHPFAPFIRIPKKTVLLIDAENMPKRLDDGFKMITPQLMALEQWELESAFLWTQPGGVDIRNRVHRLKLEAILTKIRPELVCAGPLYKMFRLERGERDDMAANDVQGIFDDLRTRYGFAVIIEAHAPQDSNGVRELRPKGAADWRYWPEVGMKFIPDVELNAGLPKPMHYNVGFYREPRFEHFWPSVMSKAQHGKFPWSASAFSRPDWERAYRGLPPQEGKPFDNPFPAMMRLKNHVLIDSDNDPDDDPF